MCGNFYLTVKFFSQTENSGLKKEKKNCVSNSKIIFKIREDRTKYASDKKKSPFLFTERFQPFQKIIKALGDKDIFTIRDSEIRAFKIFNTDIRIVHTAHISKSMPIRKK